MIIDTDYMDKNIFTTINKMALPVLLSSLVEIIFGIADQAIIGRTSIEGYAAVGVVANLLYAITGTLGSLSIAFVILFGKALGSEDEKQKNYIFSTAFSLAIVILIVVGVITLVFGRLFLETFLGLQEDVLEYACDYLAIAGWGVGLNMLIFLFSAYFKNLKKTYISMAANIVSLGVNFIVDYTLVFGKFGFPRLGVKGAAIGTVVGLALNVVIFVIAFQRIKIVKFSFGFKGKELGQLIKLYIPILGQDFVEATLFIMLVSAMVGRLDTYSIATYNILEVIAAFVILPAHAYGGVAMALVAENLQKLSKKELIKYPGVSIVCSEILITITGLCIIFIPGMLEIITDNAKLIKQAYDVLLIAVGIQLINAVSQIFKYTLQSTEDERWVFIYSAIVIIMSSVLICVNLFAVGMGIAGVYAGVGVMYVMMAGGYVVRFLSYKSHRCDTTNNELQLR